MHKFHITLSGIYGLTALTINSQQEDELGGIDLSTIEFTLKDSSYISKLKTPLT